MIAMMFLNSTLTSTTKVTGQIDGNHSNQIDRDRASNKSRVIINLPVCEVDCINDQDIPDNGFCAGWLT